MQNKASNEVSKIVATEAKTNAQKDRRTENLANAYNDKTKQNRGGIVCREVYEITKLSQDRSTKGAAMQVVATQDKTKTHIDASSEVSTDYGSKTTSKVSSVQQQCDV